MFKHMEPGTWCRIRYEGRSVEAEITARRGHWYTFKYFDEQGQRRTGKVISSQIMGRIFRPHATSRYEAAGEPSCQSSAIVCGAWHHFKLDGRDILGVVYRVHGQRYTLIYLADGAAKAVILAADQICAEEPSLTAAFREAMAEDPGYLERWIAMASSSSGEEGLSAASRPATDKHGSLAETEPPRTVQKMLFVE